MVPSLIINISTPLPKQKEKNTHTDRYFSLRKLTKLKKENKDILRADLNVG